MEFENTEYVHLLCKNFIVSRYYFKKTGSLFENQFYYANSN